MKELEGAWEPKYSWGPRVEIKGKKLTRLWRGSPVLETSFTVRQEGEDLVLDLRYNGMRYSRDAAPYATVEECRFSGGRLLLKDYYPISGPSSEELYPSDYSRYGAFDPDPELLRYVQGHWESTDGQMYLYIHGSTLEYGYKGMRSGRAEVVAGRTRSGGTMIYDKDPSVSGVGTFGRMEVRGEIISTYIPVCDAPNMDVIFRRKPEGE